jgi:hypothetical protein
MEAFLVIAHPELFEAGCTTLQNIAANPGEVKEDETAMAILQHWATPFSAYMLSSNCASPFHQDNYSWPQWYEMLTTIGPYEGGHLAFLNMGVEFQYDSRTMVAFGGKLIRHCVSACVGNQICIA